MDRPDVNDPGRLLPLTNAMALGIGVETVAQVYELAKRDKPFPKILKIHGKNYIVARDRDTFRDQLISDALREAAGRKETV
jgi:hypothetical protein